MKEYEFRIFQATPEGGLASEPEVSFMHCFSDAVAKTTARTLARKRQSPVDLAYAAPACVVEAWRSRYIGTASPKYPFTDCKVTVFERLD